jgi:hypothetical protein
VTGTPGSARRRWNAALSPINPPPTITIDVGTRGAYHTPLTAAPE